MNHIVRKESHKDREIKEHTNIMRAHDIWNAVSVKFGFVHPHAFTHIEDAEVLADSRGKGSFQVME